MKIAIPKNRKELRAHLNDPLFKNSYFLMGNTLLSGSAGFFFWIFAARFYSTEDVGLGSAMLSASGLLAMLSVLGLDIALIRYLPGEKDKSGMINSCFTIAAIAALLLAVIFLSGLTIWSPTLMVLSENRIFAFAFVLFTIISSISALQGNVFVAFRQAKYSFAQAVVAVLRIAILPLMIASGAFGIYASSGLAYTLAFILGNVLIMKIYSLYRPAPAIKKSVANDMLHYSFENYIANIFLGLPNFALPLLVVNVLGAEMNAYFYVAWSISLIPLTISLATSRSLLVEGSYSPDELRKNVIKAFKFIFILLIPSILGVFVFGRYLLLLFSKEYAVNSLEVLLILSIASIPYAVIAVYATVKRVQKKIMPVIYAYGAVVGITLAGGYLLMQSMGLIGVGTAWVIGNGVVAGAVGVKSVRKRK